MGEDKAAGNDAACLICDSVKWWDCGHLVASIDGDYAECSGGVLYDDDRFERLFVNFFASQLTRDPEKKFADPLIDDVWQEWKTQDVDPEERSCDPYMLERFLTEVFQRNGADYSKHSIEGRPGMSQQFTNIFAKEPGEVLEKAYSDCKRRLNAA